MPTSLYMPSVEVHIAFTSGYATPAASRVWTDVSDYVELADLINITFGRQDELAAAGANTLTLTLDNTDGRFTAGRSGSPYFPNVKIGRPIRVQVTPPGSSTVIRFLGFIDEWPVEWDGTDSYAMAKIRASSRLARLGLSAKLRSMPEQQILAARPKFYWTLGDPSGSTAAAESSGNAGPRLATWQPDGIGGGGPVTFGNATGPGTDGLTAATFIGIDSGTSALALALRADSLTFSASTARTVRVVAKLNSLPITGGGYDADIAVTPGCGVQVTDAGLVRGIVTTGPSINDGRYHDIVCVRDGTNETLYLDGVVVATVAVGYPSSGSLPLVVGTAFPGAVAHVAIYDTALSAGTVILQAEAILRGFAGDRTDQRVTRLLGWAGVAGSEVAIVGNGSETMTYQLTAGKSVVDALRECESTEGGVLFDGRGGGVTFQNRAIRYTRTPAVTLNMAAQHVGADYAPKLDRSTLANDVEVTNPTTGEKARATSTASSDEYGIASASETSVADSYDPLQQKAAWLVGSYAEPRNRVPSLTVDVVAHQSLTPSQLALLALNISDLIAVTNAPAQADTTSPSYFVEGYTETIGPESYSITFNLSPSYPALNTFVLDDPVRGQLDGGYMLAL